jgi:hypothetical protein
MELEELGYWMSAVTDYNRAVGEATNERSHSTKL